MSKLKILVVDDDVNTCDMVRLQLEMAGYDPICAYNGREAISIIKENHLAMVILDLILPEIDGFELLREIHRYGTTPVIMLTEKSDEFDRVLGLELGADDYVTKPFSPRELSARVKAVLRRTSQNQRSDEYQIIDLPGFYVNLLSREVKINDKKVEFTPKEFDLFWFLASNRNKVFSRDELLKQVWNYEEFFGDERTVDQHIKRLRQKIDEHDSPCKITTIWGVGYKLELPNSMQIL